MCCIMPFSLRAGRYCSMLQGVNMAFIILRLARVSAPLTMKATSAIGRHAAVARSPAPETVAAYLESIANQDVSVKGLGQDHAAKSALHHGVLEILIFRLLTVKRRV